jgi:hypothetical protein
MTHDLKCLVPYPMAGIVGLIKNKPLKPIIAPVNNNPYAIALEFPDESARLYDGDLKLLLMDGLPYSPHPLDSVLDVFKC